MIDFMKRHQAQTYASLRIVTGLMYFCHGSQKMFGFPAEVRPGTPAWIIWTAGPLEVVGGILLAIGFATRPVAFFPAESWPLRTGWPMATRRCSR